MSVKLIAITKPVIEECSSAGELIAYAARVSNPANQSNKETSPKLLKYLVSNRHWSPFEMSHLVMEIKTTRDIARQILRHRSFSFQEFSQRYAEVKDKHITREARMQDQKNRQNSITNNNKFIEDWWEGAQDEISMRCESVYSEAIKMGLAKEVARAILPEGLTPSTLYMSGTIRSWIHYIHERTALGTQKEHRLIAEECKVILLNEVPELSEVI